MCRCRWYSITYRCRLAYFADMYGQSSYPIPLQILQWFGWLLSVVSLKPRSHTVHLVAHGSFLGLTLALPQLLLPTRSCRTHRFWNSSSNAESVSTHEKHTVAPHHIMLSFPMQLMTKTKHSMALRYVTLLQSSSGAVASLLKQAGFERPRVSEEPNVRCSTAAQIITHTYIYIYILYAYLWYLCMLICVFENGTYL